MTHSNTERCPECSAAVVDGMTCGELLGLVLAWEAEDAELQVEHFLTVASYNLQHPAQFTDEALRGLRAAFIEHLDNGLPVAEIRRCIGRVAAGKQRVLRRESDRRPARRDWSMTIVDVATSGQPQRAAARVRSWAASIRKEL